MSTGFALLAILLLTAAPALGFLAEVVESLVSVLPEWPDGDALPERPEGSGAAVLSGGYIATNVHVLGHVTVVNIGSTTAACCPPTSLAATR